MSKAFLIKIHNANSSNINIFLDWCKLKRRKTWQDAKNECSQSSTTLLDHTDSIHSKYVRNILKRLKKSRGIWIDLKKNASNLTIGNEVLASDLLKVKWCESADITGSIFENVSCTNMQLSSVCVKNQSK